MVCLAERRIAFGPSVASSGLRPGRPSPISSHPRIEMRRVGAPFGHDRRISKSSIEKQYLAKIEIRRTIFLSVLMGPRDVARLISFLHRSERPRPRGLRNAAARSGGLPSIAATLRRAPAPLLDPGERRKAFRGRPGRSARPQFRRQGLEKARNGLRDRAGADNSGRPNQRLPLRRDAPSPETLRQRALCDASSP